MDEFRKVAAQFAFFVFGLGAIVMAAFGLFGLWHIFSQAIPVMFSDIGASSELRNMTLA